MPQTATRVATYEDVLAAPDNMVAEVVGGALHLSPRPAGPHTVAAGQLGADLIQPFNRGRGGPGGWIIVVEPELHLGGEILVPDLAGWRRERLPQYPRGPFVTLAPDWICEVLSPRTHGFDRVEKKPAYARWGVHYLWLIDPQEQILETYELVNGRWAELASFEKNVLVRAVPFDAIELELGALWADVEAAPETE